MTEQMITAINILAMLAAFFCVVMVILIRRLIPQAPPLPWLLAGLTYASLLRIWGVLVDLDLIEVMPDRWVGVLIYPLLGMGFWQMYWALKASLSGEERRKHSRKGD
jgi:hypothetical protein